jgi:hypothetical protein
MTPDECFTLEMAHLYRRKNFNPIPSYPDSKQPMYRFAAEHGWERRFPDGWFTEESWEQRPTTNLQIQTGRMPWRLLVIDLDGEEAAYVFRQWGRVPRTWVVHREGGESRHLWFRLPGNYPHPLPKRFLWRGEGDHQAIERLCDRSLIVAPPSFHVVHRESQYRFLDRDHSYKKLGLPADCPEWILDLKPVEPERPTPEFVPPRPMHRRAVNGDTMLSWRDVLDRTDKIGVARDLGIRFTGRVSPTGWAECHAISRPDHNPSAAVHVESGVYVDQGSGDTIRFLDLYAALTGLPSWRDAVNELASKVH